MIRKIRSRLWVKAFLLTTLLMIACCATTYLCLLHFSPYVYTHDLSEVEGLAYELSDVLSTVEQDFSTDIIETVNASLNGSYDDEFVLHLFRSSGEEVTPTDLNVPTGTNLSDYTLADQTKNHAFSFLEETEQFTLFLSKNTGKESQAVEALKKALPILSIAVMTASLIAAFFYAWYMTAPIHRISKISRQMASMDFSGLCLTKRTDEIGVLSDSLNDLSSHLAQALSDLRHANQKLQADIDRERDLERQRLSFFSAVSHELKTPITIIKGQLQGMLCQIGRYKDRDTYLSQSLQVANTLENMVQELLTISRLDTPGYTCNKSPLDLENLICGRLIAFEDLCVQRKLTVHKALSPRTIIWGDAQLLQKVFDNLLSNATLHSPAGSELFVKLWQQDKQVCVSIENTQAHIPDEHIPKLFEAFYRPEQSRNRQTGGSGLGLYIVKTILDLHGANVQIANSDRGVAVTIQFM